VTHAELERELRALAADAPFPPTPDLATAVTAGLAAAPPAPARAARRAPRWALAPLRWPLAAQAAVALLASFVALMALSPGVRSAVLEALGLRGARIERREPSPQARAAGMRLDLGDPTTLAAARDRAPFHVVVPDDPGQPDGVFFDAAAPAGGQVAFVWTRPGRRPLLLTQIAALPEPVVGKAAGAGTRVEELDIDGEPGFWLSGAPHEFAFITPHHEFRTQRLRLAGDTLIWNRDGVLLRLEGADSKARALQIAHSVD
jgi:hypothetical protein